MCATLVNVIKDDCPNQLKVPFVLWTRQAVKELIESKYSLVMSLPNVGLYLKRWGFTPKKPVKKAYKQQPVLKKIGSRFGTNYDIKYY